MTKKLTKRDVLAAIKVLAENAMDIYVGDVTVTADDIINYAEVTTAQIDAKNEKAKERLAKKRAAGDELIEEVYSALTSDYQTIPQILKVLDNEELTSGKISARLTALRKAGRIHSAKVKVDGRTINGYATGAEPAAE